MTPTLVFGSCACRARKHSRKSSTPWLHSLAKMQWGPQNLRRNSPLGDSKLKKWLPPSIRSRRELLGFQRNDNSWVS